MTYFVVIGALQVHVRGTLFSIPPLTIHSDIGFLNGISFESVGGCLDSEFIYIS